MLSCLGTGQGVSDRSAVHVLPGKALSSEVSLPVLSSGIPGPSVLRTHMMHDTVREHHGRLRDPFLRSIASCPFFWDSRSLCTQNAHDARHCARASWKAARAMSPRRMCITSACAHMRAHMHAHARIHARIHARLHARRYARTCAHTCAHTCAQSPIVDQRSLLKRSLSVREAFAGVRACRARVAPVSNPSSPHTRRAPPPCGVPP